jgi:hypothetical protein
MTIVFNVFVIYTLFNQFNCRVLDDSLNVLVRISKRNGFICTKYAFGCMKLNKLYQRMTSDLNSINVFTSFSRYGIFST